MSSDRTVSTRPPDSGSAARAEQLERELASLRAEFDRTVCQLSATNAELRASNVALAECAAKLNFTIQSAGVGDWELDLATDVARRSARHDACFGYAEPVAEWGFAAFLRHVHPDDATRVEAEFRRAALGDGDWHFECRVVWPDGSVHWISAHGSVYRAAAQPPRMLGVIQDVTDRVRREDALRDAQQFFRSSIDALSNHIAVLDEAGVILAVNDAWRRFADDNRRHTPDYGVGRSYFGDFGRGPELDAEVRLVAGALDDVLNGRRPSFEREYPCHTPTEECWFVMRVTRFKSPGPVRVVVSHENVTLRKKSEIALCEANRRKDEFLATLAHELRNPLAPLRNGLEVLKSAGRDPAAAEATCAMMERQLGQMVRLVDDLLDVSRISSGKLELRRERVELAAVVRNAVETSRPLIDGHGHELSVELPADPVPLDADPVRLAQVLLNLLNNAAKYSERGGRIALTATVEGREVAVRVRDRGIGIAPAQLAGVFDMFAQVQTALDKSEGGLGIGLSLVKGLTAMHGGTVSVTSAGVGHGSEFVVRLPLADAAPANPPIAAPEETRRGAGRRVLIVDDNVDSAESLAELLTVCGHEVRTAHDGLAGVAAAEAFRPDVVVMDLGMPKLNGYEAARRIRSEAWGVAVVLVAQTGWGSAEDRRKSRDAGFDQHLVKPVDPAAMLKLLAAV